MFNKNRACQHLRSIGLSKTQSSRFASLIDKWHSKSGPEWTTSRLKLLEQYAKDRFLNKDPLIPPGWAVSSSRKYPRRFKDGLLHELFSSSNFNLELALNFCRLSSALSMYTKIEGKWKQMPPSKAQLAKVLTAIEGPVDKEPNLHLDVLDKWLVQNVSKFPHHTDVEVLPMVYYPLTGTTAPYYDHNDKIVTGIRNADMECWGIDILYSHGPLVEFFVENREFVSECVFGKGSRLLPLPQSPFTFVKVAGILSSIQELGCKLRPAANPMIILQALNERLKVVLQTICERIKEIVTFDQDAGREQLYNWISRGEKVWSLDASSFTDRFPLKFQMRILEKLVQQNVISKTMFDVFQITSEMSYWYEPIGRPIEYKFGQPQGLGPSFALATFAHYELLEALRLELGITHRPFRVLGDDVIIKNEELALSYQKWMSDCNVEINLQKSIISNSLGEFAGVQVTEDGIISRVKLGNLTSNDAFVSWYDSHVANSRPHKFMEFMFNEHPSKTMKISLPEDFGGRRNHMRAFHDEHMLPLDQFSVSKTRIIKDLNQYLVYNQKDAIKLLENKEKIQAGIINSLYLWHDSPDFSEFCTQMQEDDNYFKRNVSSTLEKAQIDSFRDRIQDCLEKVRFCKSYRSLNVVVKSNSDIFTQHGYVRETVPVNYFVNDTLHQIGKLVHATNAYFDKDPMVLKRKAEKTPTDSGWKTHLLSNSPSM